MKKAILVSCIIAVTAIIFWIGYEAGNKSQIKDILIGNNIITDELIGATQNILLLEMLSEGKIENAISQLNSRLDTQIILVNNFLPKDKSLDGRVIADNLFLRIAKYRNKFPPNKTESEVNNFLNELLKSTKQE